MIRILCVYESQLVPIQMSPVILVILSTDFLIQSIWNKVWASKLQNVIDKVIIKYEQCMSCEPF